MWGKGPQLTRGQSEVLGIVLLFALVLTVSGTVILVGGQALNDAKVDTSSESAARTMEELQSKAAQSSSDGSTQEISFAQSSGGSDVEAADGSARLQERESVSVDQTKGEINIEVIRSGANDSTFSRQLGRVTYEEEGNTLAYQGGGIFRKSTNSDESVIVSAPKFGYRYQNGAPTLNLGITTLSSSSSDVSGESFGIQHLKTDKLSPSAAVPSPLDPNDEVRITVTSEFCQAWKTLFEERTDGSVTSCNSANEVSLVLNGPDPIPLSPDASGALVTSDVGELQIQNHAFVDSYNSDSHDASTTGITQQANAPVYVRGVFKPKNHAHVDGYVHAEDRIHFVSNNGGQNENRIEGKTITGGDPTDGTPSLITGKLRFGDDFSTKDDLSVEGSNHQPGKRVLFEGDVYVGGDIVDHASGGQSERFRNTKIEGDVYVQGEVNLDDSSNVHITGDLIGANNVNVGSGVQVDGAIQDNADPTEPKQPTIPSTPSVTPDLNEKANELDYPADAPARSGDIESWGGCDPECELNDGGHRVDGLTLNSGEKLVLNTNDGPIDLFVDGGAQNGNSLYINGGEIVVKGPNEARIWSNSGVLVEKGSRFRTKPVAYDSPNFRLKVRHDAEVDINSNGGNPTIFTGVINGSHPIDGATIQIDKNARIYGAVIGDPTGPDGQGIRNDAEIHFDQALLDNGRGSQGMAVSGGSDSVAYLQVKVSEVRVKED